MKLINLLIVFLPINSLKIAIYNNLLKYEIDKKCKIGLSYIDCKKLVMKKGSSIGSFNRIENCDVIRLDNNSRINKLNKIKNISLFMEKNSVISIRNSFYCNSLYKIKNGGKMKIGINSVIVDSHKFDLTDDIIIGNDCTIAGRQSEFWTHTFDLSKNRIQGCISLGNDIYIGSGSKINLGIKVVDKSIVGMGSIVSKSLLEENCFYAGNPAKKIRNINEKIESSHKEILGELPNGKLVFKKLTNEV